MLPALSREERLGVALTIVGGIHYGYNLAIAGVVARSVAAALDADPSIEQVFLGTTLLGAVVGSPLSGLVAERSGRVPATLLGETLSLLGALVGAISFSTTALTTSRFIVGLGIGICTMCKPLYVSETVPAERRGTLLALFAPAIAVGILLAQSWPALLALFVDEPPPLDGEVIPSYHYDEALSPGGPSGGWVWRLQLLTGTIPPGIILAIALLAMPESPVYLKTQATLASVRASASGTPGRRNAASAVSDVSSLLPSVPNGALGLASKPGAGRAAAFAVMLGVTQQSTGVVGVVLFGATLLSAAAEAFGGHLETWMALVVPAANLGGAIAGAVLIDTVGRRKALLAGLSAMMATTLIPLLLLLFHAAGTPPPLGNGSNPLSSPVPGDAPAPMHDAAPTAVGQAFLTATLVCMALWAVAFELGPGCGYFVVITEVTAPEFRPLAVSLGNMVRYLIELILLFTFLSVWHATPLSPIFVLAGFALACAGCLAFFASQLHETRNADGTFNLSANWKTAPGASPGLDIESLRSDAAVHSREGYETQFPPDEPPPLTPVPRALKSLAAATSSARASAISSLRSFSFGSMPSFTAAVAHYTPFGSPPAFAGTELPLPSPLTVDVASASEVPASDGPPEALRGSSPSFLAPGRPAKSYVAYAIEARAPGARRTHRCAQRFSSFDFFLADLTKAGSLSVGSSAVRLSPAARAVIDGWRRRLLLEKMAAAGDRSRDPAVVAGRVELLRRLMQEVLAFDEVAEADVTYAFIFGPGWREGDPTDTL